MSSPAVVRMVAASFLEDAGFRTYEADDVDAALAILRGHHPSIVLLFTDVEMPSESNGFQLARKTAQSWPSHRHPGRIGTHRS